MLAPISASAVGLSLLSLASARGGERTHTAPNQQAAAGSGPSPSYPLFAYPLPIPEVAIPVTSVTTDGVTIDYYEVTIEEFSKKVYPNLGTADFVGYSGVTPGPTYRIQRGTQTVIRYQNQQTRNCSVHLHGSDTHSPWDGWADDMIAPGSYKDYYYPNDHMARSIWYHDHADHVTGDNAYQGLGGVYIIDDPTEDALGLPSGDYDVPLTIVDRIYNADGGLVLPNSNINEFGDIIEVNGQPFPYFSVEPRKYRFRIFDMSLSRPYELYLAQPNGDWLDFQVIASDCGLFGSPVTTNDLVIAMGERYEIVVDFSPYSGQNITMLNNMGLEGNIEQYGDTDQVMQFNVGTTVSDDSNNGDVPSTLNPDISWPEAVTDISHTFNFQVGGDARWTINGVDYDDVNNRVLARPVQGTTELWEVRYAGGPGVHPVHVHLVSFQIVSRTGGSRGVLPYESAGLKDIVLLEPGETATFRAYYGPWNGLFMFHCHNLIHEDNAMMAAFNLTTLDSLGYNATEDFADPTDPRFIAQVVEGDSYDIASISSTLSYLAALQAYDTTLYGGSSSTIGTLSASPATASASASTSNAPTTTSSVLVTNTGTGTYSTATTTTMAGSVVVVTDAVTSVVTAVVTEVFTA